MSLDQESKDAIQEEERVLAEVLTSLKAQLQDLSRRFDVERTRARELTSELVAAWREEDKAMLASDEAVAHALSHKQAGNIGTLEKLLQKPYFARFIVREYENGCPKDLEYKLGLAANPECRIVDWRKAPISKLYYNYKEGEEYCDQIQNRERSGVVILRHAVEITNGELVRLSCRHGTFTKKNGHWERLSGPARARSEHAAAEEYSHLPDVLSLITPEQFKTITEDADTAILIQGIAGSGKTTVALHRLAWLLHEDNSTLKANECVIVVPTPALKTYIANTLPSIGLQDVRVLTYLEWVADNLVGALPRFFDEHGRILRPADRPPRAVLRLMRSMALLKHMEQFEQNLRQKLFTRLKSAISREEAPPGLSKLLQNMAAVDAPIGVSLRELKAGVQRGLEAIHPAKPAHRALLSAQAAISREEEKLMDLEGGMLEILSVPEEIIKCDETRLLDREIADQVLMRFKQTLAEGTLDRFTDAALLRLLQIRTSGINPSGAFGPRYKHIVVDEIQDFGPIDLAALVKAAKDPRGLTLVGDTSQKIDETTIFPGWQKLMRHWDFKESVSKYITLTVNHRSTIQIMKLAQYIPVSYTHLTLPTIYSV